MTPIPGFHASINMCPMNQLQFVEVLHHSTRPQNVGRIGTAQTLASSSCSFVMTIMMMMIIIIIIMKLVLTVMVAR